MRMHENYYWTIPSIVDESDLVRRQCPNVSTTPLRQWGIRQCLPFSWTTLRGKHCRHPIAVMGVVVTFGPSVLSTLWVVDTFGPCQPGSSGPVIMQHSERKCIWAANQRSHSLRSILFFARPQFFCNYIVISAKSADENCLITTST